MQTDTELTPKQRLRAAIDKHRLTVTATFIPFSQSRNAKPRKAGEKPWRSLNWQVTLQKNGTPILSTDYSSGIAACPASKASPAELGGANSIMRYDAITYKIEHGRRYQRGFGKPPAVAIMPDPVDVIYSLVSDSDAIDYPFEEWAANLGYDTDSRSAESTHRACLDIAVAIRRGIGDAALQELRDAAQDY